jgi:hypothetical protein
MKKHNVIIPSGISPYPEKFEISAAVILTRHFMHDVEFIHRAGVSTPDIKIGNIRWEIKSPTGNGKRTIQHQIHRALSQSRNIVFDARRTKMHLTKIRSDLTRYAKETPAIKRLVLIGKDESVTVIK